jgi:hypothetical protein
MLRVWRRSGRALRAAPSPFGSELLDLRPRWEFAAEVERYLAGLRASLPQQALAAYRDAGLGQLQLEIANLTEHPLNGLQLRLALPLGVEPVTPEGRVRRPKPPRPYGSSPPPDLLFKMLTAPRAPLAGWALLSDPLDHAEQVDADGDEATGAWGLTFPTFALRPRATRVLPAMCLRARAGAGGAAIATWTATALDADGEAGGEIAFEIADSALDGCMLFQKLVASL